MSEDDWTTEDMRRLHDNIFGRYFRPRFDRWLAQHDAEVTKAERERIIKLLIDENFFCNGHWHHECPDDKNCKLTINGGWHGKSPCQLDFMGGSDCKRAIALIKGENE